jgi:hypothetical protein
MHEDLRGHLAGCQHDFVKGRSIVSNLFECFFFFVLKAIEDGSQMDLIYTDFSKAIDRVRHCLLLDKMSSVLKPAIFLPIWTDVI